jgi:hypothetical protein
MVADLWDNNGDRARGLGRRFCHLGQEKSVSRDWQWLWHWEAKSLSE